MSEQKYSMRLLYFITFFTAVLFSEVVMHVAAWDQDYAMSYDLPMDDTNENENGEESKEDRAEEEKLIQEFSLVEFIEDEQVNALRLSDSVLLTQSMQEIHSPPPDLG